MTEQAFRQACDELMGWCRHCRDFTTFGCEPDARCYVCEVCGKRTVFGAEEALVMGLIDLDDGGDDQNL
jgi:hypothetical protein